jgi:hypothetical protein
MRTGLGARGRGGDAGEGEWDEEREEGREEGEKGRETGEEVEYSVGNRSEDREEREKEEVGWNKEEALAQGRQGVLVGRPGLALWRVVPAAGAVV